ncbi:hypothetical protein HDU97_007508 [Phlyctochytrium planicorne]|nr:hypothetical protein HDU97_007508 [Phlyctochytrium planicorne]
MEIMSSPDSIFLLPTQQLQFRSFRNSSVIEKTNGGPRTQRYEGFEQPIQTLLDIVRNRRKRLDVGHPSSSSSNSLQLRNLKEDHDGFKEAKSTVLAFKETTRAAKLNRIKLQSLLEEVAELPSELVSPMVSKLDLTFAAARVSQKDHVRPDDGNGMAMATSLRNPALSPTISEFLSRNGLNSKAVEYSWYLTRFGPFSVDRILGFIDAMRTVDGVEPDRSTYIAAAKVLSKKARSGDLALKVLTRMKKEGFELDWEAHHTALLGWVRAGQSYRAYRYFQDLISEQKRLVIPIAEPESAWPDRLGGSDEMTRNLSESYAASLLPLNTSSAAPKPLPVNVVNTVLHGMALAKDHKAMVDILVILDMFNLNPDTVTWNICLEYGATRLPHKNLLECLDLMREANLLRTDTFNAILTAYFKIGQIANAISLFETMAFGGDYPEPDIITFTIMINFCGKEGLSAHLSRYVDMIRSRVVESRQNLATAERLMMPDASFYKVMLANFVQSGDFRSASECFKDLLLHAKQYKPYDFHQMMKLQITEGKHEEAWALFLKMKAQAVPLTGETFRVLVKASVNSTFLERLLDELSKIKLQDHEVRMVCNAIYSELLDKKDAKDPKAILAVVDQIIGEFRVLPEVETMNSFENKLVNEGNLDGLFLLSDWRARNSIYPTLSRSSLIEMLSLANNTKEGKSKSSLDRALNLLKEFYGKEAVQTTACYNQLLFANAKDDPRMLKLLRQMKRLEIPWDAQTLHILFQHAFILQKFYQAWAVWLKTVEKYDAFRKEFALIKRPSTKDLEARRYFTRVLTRMSRIIFKLSFRYRNEQIAEDVVARIHSRNLNFVPVNGTHDAKKRVERAIRYLDRKTDRDPDDPARRLKARSVNISRKWVDVLDVEKVLIEFLKK